MKYIFVFFSLCVHSTLLIAAEAQPWCGVRIQDKESFLGLLPFLTISCTIIFR